jgi:hypothetical protein
VNVADGHHPPRLVAAGVARRFSREQAGAKAHCPEQEAEETDSGVLS